eukprot:TRINITY_DN30836_c0_g1_i1.p1 TRINITY_DN30836_c0_g1~~TRINITY_DN30836_c0_g1_i1.p1  ORF type:complete len:430 (-),score=34.71 TRINITY_DN30836_c0_g1_i1:113-1402(-)
MSTAMVDGNTPLLPQKGRFNLGNGTLLLRAADGFARNIILANQIVVFNVFAGLGQNSAQQVAKFLAAFCGITPALAGYAVSRMALPLERVILTGCFLEIVGLALLFASAAYLIGVKAVYIALFGCFAPGFGMLTSSLSVLGASETLPEIRPIFFQRYYIYLAVGAIPGIVVAGMSESLERFAEGFLVGLLVLIAGSIAFVKRSERDPGTEGTRDSEESKTRIWQFPWPLIALIPYYAAYLQWTTSWYVQALYMDRFILGFKVPACTMQLAERFTSILGFIFLEGISKKWSMQARLVCGSAIAGLALFVSALVEVTRRNADRMEGFPEVSTLSVLWTFPQFCLISLSSVLIFPAQTEWASRCPLLTGLGIVVQAAAALMLGLALPYLHSWLPQSSPNEGHYDLFFLSLALGCTISVAILASLPPGVWKHA